MLPLVAYVLVGGAMLGYFDVSSETPPKILPQLQIYGPATSGGAPKRLDTPSPEEIIKAAKLQSEKRLQIVGELVAENADPVCLLPLIGPARRHVATYRIRTHEGVRDYLLTHQHLHLVAE